MTRSAIDRLTAVGQALGLEGRFGCKWGLIQLRARLDALEAAVMDDAEPAEPLEHFVAKLEHYARLSMQDPGPNGAVTNRSKESP